MLIPGPQIYGKVIYIGILSSHCILHCLVFCRVILKLSFLWCQKLKVLADKLTETNNKDISPHLNRQYDFEECFPDRILKPEHYDVSEDNNEAQQSITDSTKSVLPTYGIQ